MTLDPPTGPRRARRLAWLYLALAILIEVVGLTVMKAASVNGGVAGYIVMYVAIAFSYVCLAKAVRTLPVGVAYAIWEGSGIALITLVSVFFFHHDLSLRELIGLGMAVLGIILVNAGEDHGAATSGAADERA
ncbi:spermidine export protein MdtJ [Rhizobium sp. PP-F2F-G48]|uniref:SMR family transporter n=1 Tax=Rhizobium sp. PP-F2F-G48 TaxID=2135651 RepID=UPI0010452100|nr:multidrug efflux SMR transporter [Rhizobium sp. PP-F2F-G48]TCM57249.1 spermidine export protein MdtJ [Rhizobium sp. PP-F2F-G48]